MGKPSKAARDFAKDLIRRVIDAENKYVPDAQYEMSGKHLVEYLAHAYESGRESAKEESGGRKEQVRRRVASQGCEDRAVFVRASVPCPRDAGASS